MGKQPTISSELRKKSNNVSAKSGTDATCSESSDREGSTKVVRKPRKRQQNVDKSGRVGSQVGGESKGAIPDGGSEIKEGTIISTVLVDDEANNQLGSGKRKRKDAPKLQTKRKSVVLRIVNGEHARNDEAATTNDRETSSQPTTPATTTSPILQQDCTHITPSSMGSSTKEDDSLINPEAIKLDADFVEILNILKMYHEDPEWKTNAFNPGFKWKFKDLLFGLTNVILDGKLPEGSLHSMEEVADLNRKGRALYNFLYPFK